MHKIIKTLFITLMIGFTNCSSSQKAMTLQKTIPFSITTAFAQPWTAGIKGGGSGINVQLTILGLNKAEISLKELYFRGKKTTLEDNSTNDNGLYIAYFNNSPEKEIILHGDHKKEAGNEPPKLSQEVPFDIEKNEAVISYTEKGTLKYYKLNNIIEKFPIYYPSAPENKQ